MMQGSLLGAVLFISMLAACAQKEPTPFTFHNEKTGKIGRLAEAPDHVMTATEIKECFRQGKAEKDGLSSCECQALADQLHSCWRAQVDENYSEDTIVKVQLTLSENRHVITSNIVDLDNNKNDPSFMSVANTSLQGLNSKECKTLNLPPEKYEIWRNIIVTFDPRDML